MRSHRTPPILPPSAPLPLAHMTFPGDEYIPVEAGTRTGMSSRAVCLRHCSLHVLNLRCFWYATVFNLSYVQCRFGEFILKTEKNGKRKRPIKYQKLRDRVSTDNSWIPQQLLFPCSRYLFRSSLMFTNCYCSDLWTFHVDLLISEWYMYHQIIQNLSISPVKSSEVKIIVHYAANFNVMLRTHLFVAQNHAFPTAVSYFS